MNWYEQIIQCYEIFFLWPVGVFIVVISMLTKYGLNEMLRRFANSRLVLGSKLYTFSFFRTVHKLKAPLQCGSLITHFGVDDFMLHYQLSRWLYYPIMADHLMTRPQPYQVTVLLKPREGYNGWRFNRITDN